MHCLACLHLPARRIAGPLRDARRRGGRPVEGQRLTQPASNTFPGPGASRLTRIGSGCGAGSRSGRDQQREVGGEEVSQPVQHLACLSLIPQVPLAGFGLVASDDPATNIGAAGPSRVGERRWPMALAVLAAGGLRALLPPEIRNGDPRWLFLAILIPLLVVLIIGDPGRIDRDSRRLRAATGTLIGLITLVNAGAALQERQRVPAARGGGRHSSFPR